MPLDGGHQKLGRSECPYWQIKTLSFKWTEKWQVWDLGSFPGYLAQGQAWDFMVVHMALSPGKSILLNVKCYMS